MSPKNGDGSYVSAGRKSVEIGSRKKGFMVGVYLKILSLRLEPHQVLGERRVTVGWLTCITACLKFQAEEQYEGSYYIYYINTSYYSVYCRIEEGCWRRKDEANYPKRKQWRSTSSGGG
jgi:hypothetical protein